MNLSLDFTEIGDEEEFFFILKEREILPQNFEGTFEGLQKFILQFATPVEWEFYNLNVEQLEIFDELITSLEEVEEWNNNFNFRYYLEQFEEE